MGTSFHAAYDAARRIYTAEQWFALGPRGQSAAIYREMRRLDVDSVERHNLRRKPRAVLVMQHQAA